MSTTASTNAETDPVPAAPSSDAALSSGPSPTVAFAPTAHLIGVGRIGRALLALAAETPVRFIAASDRSATVYSEAGLPAAELQAAKSAGRPLADHPLAAPLPLDIALSVTDPDLVIDATDSDLAPAARAAALARTRNVLRSGKQLVLAAKTPLLLDVEELAAHRAQLHVAAVFGGTGSAWLAELAASDDDAAGAPGRRSFAGVVNATTTEVIAALERGGSLADGLASARAAGLVEADATQDLDGRDAALKLALVARLAFGVALAPESIERPHLVDLDPELLQARARRGATTRLVGRLAPDGTPSLRYEELPRGDRLALPCGRVGYAFAAADGTTRLHLGRGVGALGTARALQGDLSACARALRGLAVTEAGR